MSVTRKLGLYLYSQDGSNSALSSVVHGDIVPSINKLYNHWYIYIKLHLRVFVLLKMSNIFHYWQLCDFDHI